MLEVMAINLRTEPESRVGHGSRPGLTKSDVISGLNCLLNEALAIDPLLLLEQLWRPFVVLSIFLIRLSVGKTKDGITYEAEW
jgi:hypothetical protein